PTSSWPRRINDTGLGMWPVMRGSVLTSLPPPHQTGRGSGGFAYQARHATLLLIPSPLPFATTLSPLPPRGRGLDRLLVFHSHIGLEDGAQALGLGGDAAFDARAGRGEKAHGDGRLAATSGIAPDAANDPVHQHDGGDPSLGTEDVM